MATQSPPSKVAPRVQLPQRPTIDTTDGGVGTWIGFTGLGFGVVILYSAVKDVPLFGANGIITNAVTKGQLTHVVDRPPSKQAKASQGQKLVQGLEAGAAGPATLNHAVGNVGKSVGNSIAGTVGLGGIANTIEHLPVIGRVINDGGNIFQAAGEIGQEIGRPIGQGIGHGIASAAKSFGEGLKSYASKLKGIL